MAPATLVVCSNPAERASYAGWLRSDGYRAVEAESSAEALALHKREAFALTLADLVSPLVDGIGLIEGVRTINPRAEFLLLLSSNDSPQAVMTAMRAGAAEPLVRPIDRPTLLTHIRQITGTQPQDTETAEADIRKRYDFSLIVGDSPQMLRILSLAGRVAGHDTPVLITGESGTGKELLARAIHINSPRAARPMVAVNCAAIPEPLLESELFGYRRGAFTGAHADKQAILSTADGGTLFLDEIADLPLETQAKLLRFLEDGTFYSLGAVRPTRADVRVLAATNATLPDRVAGGYFRRDLYYRLAGFPLHIPPLRERPQDILPSAKYFLAQLGREVGKKVPGLSREAVRYIQARRWRGNARELRNAVERAVIVSSGNLLTSADFQALEADIESDSSAPAGAWQLPEEGIDLPALTRALIATALERTGNVSTAARLLGLTRPALRYRMEKYGFGKKAHQGNGARTLPGPRC